MTNPSLGASAGHPGSGPQGPAVHGAPQGPPIHGAPHGPPVPSPAAAAAKPGEDLRWRVAPRWAQVGQLAVAVLFLGNAALQATLGGNNGILHAGSVIYVLGAGVFIANFVLLGGWTSANREGLHSFNGARHRELRWSDLKQISRKRLSIRATTQDGRTVPLPGINQARLAELTGIWTHYRGADGPQQALTHDARDGLWPVDPSRRFRMPGSVLSMVALIVGAFAALVVGMAIILSEQSVVIAVVAVVVTLLVFLIPPMRLTTSGTTLTPEGLKVRLPWSTRTMRWQDVQQVIGAGEYAGVLGRDGKRSTLYGVPVTQGQVVEAMRAQAVQRDVSR